MLYFGCISRNPSRRYVTIGAEKIESAVMCGIAVENTATGVLDDPDSIVLWRLSRVDEGLEIAVLYLKSGNLLDNLVRDLFLLGKVQAGETESQVVKQKFIIADPAIDGDITGVHSTVKLTVALFVAG